MNTNILIQVNLGIVLVVQLKSCVTCILKSLLWSIPYMNLAHTYATSLITCLSNVFTICILRTTDIIRIFRPYQALYLSLSWLEQSIV